MRAPGNGIQSVLPRHPDHVECRHMQRMPHPIQKAYRPHVLGGHLVELRAGWEGIGRLCRCVLRLPPAGVFAGVIRSPYKAAMESPDQMWLQAVQPAEPFLVYNEGLVGPGLLISSPWVFNSFGPSSRLACITTNDDSAHRRSGMRYAVCRGRLVLPVAIAPWVFRFFMQFDLGIDYLPSSRGWARRRTSS
jgi:hypothetical protein